MCQFALGMLMTVEIDAGGSWEVIIESDAQRPKVFFFCLIDVVLIAHYLCVDQPGKAGPPSGGLFCLMTRKSAYFSLAMPK